MMLLTMFTHNVLVHPDSGLENVIYPKMFIVIAAAYIISVKNIRYPAYCVYPAS